MKKTYFISPNFDIAPPPAGPLKLGHIIQGPDEPDIEPLNVDSYIAAPAPLPPMLKTGFSSSRSKLLAGELGIWAQVMATMGVHASAGFDRSSDDELNVREIEAQTFQPSLIYVQRSVAGLDVAAFLEQTRYIFPVYLITGLKIARGASIRSRSSRSINASGVVDLPIDGAQVASSGKLTHSRAEHGSFDDSSDSILAFRIQRVRFRVKDGVPEIRDRVTYVKGAKMLGDDVETTQGHEVPEVLGLQDEAYELPEEVGLLDGVHHDDDDGDQLCAFALLR
ncbi:hypothetical protein TI39_contig4230g00002 [Zymoseptoria brevis]|uniref:Uncharacterized protein n=1 Tax=Zymoseptoria brevis TaxID=1047168 RepID=A0A0F4G999_9PEZI|nr:hypothetical protein TI39_contig4230g00002 [Zymoseptoria brevis]